MNTANQPPIDKAVILAGGLGTRLAPLTTLTPKPILPIGESTILEIQLHALHKHGVSEVYIATNYLHESVVAKIGDGSDYGLKVRFSRETKRLGTCGPLSLLRHQLDRPFAMMNGDILTSIDITRFGTFALSKNAALTVATKEINIPFRFGRVLAEGDYVVDIEEKPDFKQEVLAGIYAMTPAALELVPDDTYFGMDELIKTMMATHRPVAKYKMTEYWVDIGQLDDYELAKEMFASKDADAVLSSLPEHQ
jgi:NDP-mannose synthase